MMLRSNEDNCDDQVEEAPELDEELIVHIDDELIRGKTRRDQLVQQVWLDSEANG